MGPRSQYVNSYEIRYRICLQYSLGWVECADPGILGRGGGGGPGPTARKQLVDSSDDVFLVLNLFYSFTVVYQLFISKENIFSQGFRGV